MMKMINRSAVLGVALACIFLSAGPLQAAEYAVVIQASNTYSDNPESMKQVVKQLFLKQRSEWPNKIAAKPFARPADNAAHQAFLKHVVQMSEVELAGHWISVKQRTGQAAPREIARDSLLFKLIAKYDGALAVVVKESVQSDQIRILFTFTD